MTRHRARVDGNQPLIVEAARCLGCSVQHLHEVGRGCPDLCIGVMGLNLMVEVKDPSQPPSKRKLTQAEQEWHDSWRGQVVVIETPEQLAALIGRLKSEPYKGACGECQERGR